MNPTDAGRVVFLAMFLISSASCRGPSQPTPQGCFPDPPKSSIAWNRDHSDVQGHVFQLPGAVPSKQAMITLQPGRLSRFSDTAGFFRFANLKPGRYLITVRAMGLQQVQDSITQTAAGVEVVVVLAPYRPDMYECIVSGRIEKAGPSRPKHF